MEVRSSGSGSVASAAQTRTGLTLGFQLILGGGVGFWGISSLSGGRLLGPNPHLRVAGTPSGLSRPLSANLATLITRQGPARLRSQLATDLPLRG